MNGTLETVGERPALRFERRLAHPVERVWRAVTDPAELAQWFVAPVDWTPEAGERFESLEQPGEIVELEPPRRIAWLWGGERFGFELRPDGDGCLLVFTHVFDDRALGAQHAAGWELYLGRLDSQLAGTHVPMERLNLALPEVHERYAERFGLDPEVGRRAIADHLRP
jgi:uncharacterized protein YndB with AHSA1/START domain